MKGGEEVGRVEMSYGDATARKSRDEMEHRAKQHTVVEHQLLGDPRGPEEVGADAVDRHGVDEASKLVSVAQTVLGDDDR